MGDKLYFSAVDTVYGNELRWIDTAATLPTVVNTIDINTGSSSSSAGLHGGFTVVGTRLYFSAVDAATGYELRWIDTAVASPTVTTIDIYDGADDSHVGRYSDFWLVGTKLYFTAKDPAKGYQLRWVDAAAVSPAVRTIDFDGSRQDSISGCFAVVGTKLYFSGSDSLTGNELRWIDTALASPTINTIDFNIGVAGSDPILACDGSSVVDTRLYFSAIDEVTGRELRWIDTSEASPTVNSIDIYRGPRHSRAGDMWGNFAVAGTKLYFSAADADSGFELRWIDTSETSPTVHTIDIYHGPESSDAGSFGGFKVVGTKLYFSAIDADSGEELHWIDTTAASPTINTVDIVSGIGSSNAGRGSNFVVDSNKLYFKALKDQIDLQLYWIDTESASPVASSIAIYAGNESSNPGGLGGTSHH